MSRNGQRMYDGGHDYEIVINSNGLIRIQKFESLPYSFFHLDARRVLPLDNEEVEIAPGVEMKKQWFKKLR